MPLDPTDRAQLTRIERASYRAGEVLRETHLGRRACARWLDLVTFTWARPLAVPITHADGLEHLPTDRSLILAANHRTFFDLYAVMATIWRSFPKPPFMFCPVRSDFFYDSKLGPLLNFAVSAYSMYPPVFRDERGRGLNGHVVSKCVSLLDDPRTIVGLHPEGRRSRDPDPYKLSPGRPGIGRIALPAKAPVIPVFVAGLSSSFLAQASRRFTGQPIRLFFGPPVPADDLYERPHDPAAHLELADRTMVALRACGDRDRMWAATAGR